MVIMIISKGMLSLNKNISRQCLKKMKNNLRITVTPDPKGKREKSKKTYGFIDYKPTKNPPFFSFSFLPTYDKPPFLFFPFSFCFSPRTASLFLSFFFSSFFSFLYLDRQPLLPITPTNCQPPLLQLPWSFIGNKRWSFNVGYLAKSLVHGLRATWALHGCSKVNRDGVAAVMR